MSKPSAETLARAQAWADKAGADLATELNAGMGYFEAKESCIARLRAAYLAGSDAALRRREEKKGAKTK